MSLLGSVIGDYKIQQKIGSGGMGVVYRGLHVRLGQVVAVKDLSPELASDPEMRQRFIREARIQAQLNHPNVVNVHNLLEHDGRLLLVMEFVEGETLDKLIQDNGALPYDKAIEIIRPVLDALSFMHSKGVIHRDLKPGNIMIAEEGRVKVTDFGIAKATTERGQTRVGTRLGTLWYMSPEQIKGGAVDARSDLYATGITLFQMVTGKLPFFGSSDFEIMKAHTETPPPDPKKIKKGIPEPLSGVILKLLEKDPGKRYQTAGEALKALDFPKASKKSFLMVEKGVERKAKAHISLNRQEKPSMLIWIIVAALLLGVGIIIFGYWYLNRKPSVIPVVKKPEVEKKAVSSPRSEKVGGVGTFELKPPAPEKAKQPTAEKRPVAERHPEPDETRKQPPAKHRVSSKTEKSVSRSRSIKSKKVKQPSAAEGGKGISANKGKQTSKKDKKQDEGERLTIDKQLGHFFKSLKKSIRDLEHSKGEGSSPSSTEENPSGRDDYFPRD